MVAGSHHHCDVIAWRPVNFWWQQRSSSIYLFFVLNEVAEKT